jgi:hypothetical protein
MRLDGELRSRAHDGRPNGTLACTRRAVATNIRPRLIQRMRGALSGDVCATVCKAQGHAARLIQIRLGFPPRKYARTKVGSPAHEHQINRGVPTNNGVAVSFEARLPAGWGVARTKEAILRVHPALKKAWGRGFGYRLMFIESQVLIAILQDLTARNVPALGLHDGRLVGVSKREVAREAMRKAAKGCRRNLPVPEK